MAEFEVKENPNRKRKAPVEEKVDDNATKNCKKEANIFEVAPEGNVGQPIFDFKQNCLFCGREAKLSPRVFPVKKINFHNTIIRIIKERNDDWAMAVSSRIPSETDLLAVNAIYHQQCNVNFRTNRNIPNAGNSVVKKGAPVNMNLHNSFLQLVQFMEQSVDPYSTSDLIDKLQEFSAGEKYTVRYLKDKLLQHFGDRIIFISRSGLSDIVIMKEASERIIRKFYEEKCKSNEEINMMMEKTANWILNDINTVKNNKEEYPLPSEISSEDYGLSFLPRSLKTFLQSLFGKKKTNEIRKIIAFGHAIMQACRPRSLLAPLQLGLGVQIHHFTGSRFLIDVLHSLGFCCSYAEVHKYEICASVSDRENELPISDNGVTKYVADNVDHNLCTLDGKGTFHGMGMISIESLTQNKKEKRIRRKTATIEDVKNINNVEIIYYSEDTGENVSLKYKVLPQAIIDDLFSKLDILWTLSWPSVSERPAWSGFMQLVTTGPKVTKPTITFLPMIDLSSSSMTCIYSTMNFVAKEAEKNGTSAVLTFDQPLYWKARLIIAREPSYSPIKKIVLMLGGFHMKMSYIGCIGYLMSGSGLQEILEQIYAPNSVTKMLNGKAIARSIRGHILLYSALNAVICEELFTEEEKSEIAKLFNDIAEQKVDIEELATNSILTELEQKYIETKNKLQLLGPTICLWLQYIKMIDILKSNIRADRTGAFQLHLQTAEAMLPFFPASGHNSYAKSVYIYLQDMQDLKQSNPQVYDFFESGNFVTRRSNRFWGALPDDLIIEQVLMRSVKSGGGLTRRRGFGEAQRAVWLQSMPHCAAINDAMQLFTHTVIETSEQHKEIGLTRQKRDIHDTKLLYEYLKERSVFANDSGLRNIVDGVISHSSSNPHDAEKLGMAIIRRMQGKDVSEFIFKKEYQVIVMNSKNTIQIDNENVQIDPEVLFQRLISVQNSRNNEDLEIIFKYELTQRPPALFDEKGFLRGGNESVLSNTLWKKIGSKVSCGPLTDSVYVLSGDWIINKVIWQVGETFNDICNRYVEFILRMYGNSTTVILNKSASGPSIMDDSHQRNKKGICSLEISFTGATPLKIKKQEFLSNTKNKDRFIEILSAKLKCTGCNVINGVGDPNILIAKTAADLSQNRETIVIGEESDLLILLCYYTTTENAGLYLRSDEKNKTKKNTRLWNITETQNLLGPTTSTYLLFVHAFGGCQSTSHVFGVGQGTIYTKLSNKFFSAQAEIFCNKLMTKEQVINAGEEAMVLLFQGKPGEKLNSLRFRKYKEKVATETSSVVAKRLPPTESATSYHSLRAYYQIQTWMQQNGLNPLEYGWKETNDRYTPILTDLPPAPPNLLSVIRCRCNGNCTTLRCNCKKERLFCTTACINCNHDSCLNCDIATEREEDNDLDEI